jgi:hypothetical protein
MGVNHGICEYCDELIECLDPFGCSSHSWIKAHMDLKICIGKLKKSVGFWKSEYQRMDNKLNENGVIWRGEPQ